MPFRKPFAHSSRLSVLDRNLRLILLCAHCRPAANRLRTLFLKIYHGQIPLSSTIDPPLAILAGLSSAFPHPPELGVVLGTLCNELLGWGNESSTLNLPHLRRFHAAPLHIDMYLD